nr:uncharacterized protein LOC127303705 [Lolium perenne]
MTVSMNGITGANQSFDTYWLRVKQAFDERKLVDPYFSKMNMNRGDKAMATNWGIIQTACSKWHGVQEEIKERPMSGHDLEQKLRRALDMDMDDTGMQFKFLNVYARIEKCEKWAETRKTLSKRSDRAWVYGEEHSREIFTQMVGKKREADAWAVVLKMFSS